MNIDTFDLSSFSRLDLADFLIRAKYELSRKTLIDIVRPALDGIGKGGLAAEQLVLGTGIQESLLIYRTQQGNPPGPALGLFQMEPDTHDDIWGNYLAYESELANLVKSTLQSGQKNEASTLKTNDKYAAAMCRVHYSRNPDPLPPVNDVTALAKYWKKFYNTPEGAGTVKEFKDKWPLYVNADTFK